MAWYETAWNTATDYTAVPFGRGALFGGAQFVNWGLGKILPRAIYPEEYERMNAEELERAKDIFFPYRTAGNGKGNVVTDVEEFASGLYGGGAVAKVGLKGGGKLLAAAPKVGRFVVQHAPKAGKIIRRSGPAAAKAEKAAADVSLSAQRLSVVRNAYNPADPNSVKALELAEKALADAKATALPGASAGARTAATASKFRTAAGKAVDYLGREGKVPLGEWVGGKWAAHMPYSLTGPYARALAYGVDSFAVGAGQSYGVGKSVRNQMDAFAAAARTARDDYYRTVANGFDRFERFQRGEGTTAQDVTDFLRAASAESARIGKLTDRELSRAVPQAFSQAAPEGGLSPYQEVMAAYRLRGAKLPKAAFDSVKAAYKDDQAGYRKLLESKVDREILPSIFGEDKLPTGYSADMKFTDAAFGDRVKAVRDRFLANPNVESDILQFQREVPSAGQ